VRDQPSVICPRCETYIGDLANLDVCPVCGYGFDSESFFENSKESE
jgi:rubrerythrin